ncbi:hypothetical protein [Nocardioides soli]|uniref:Uncharacterized protein n=1 Tax=Nocardioides soli TaxID=1036020 RepID=A0A7W4W2B0_9ACTN|nr:hypothetical protein [Nocardioides soli]MBB3045627.1 hypothetical protein [Nocardioides soli]
MYARPSRRTCSIMASTSASAASALITRIRCSRRKSERARKTSAVRTRNQRIRSPGVAPSGPPAWAERIASKKS